jgi:hypothetical protein
MDLRQHVPQSAIISPDPEPPTEVARRRRIGDALRTEGIERTG